MKNGGKREITFDVYPHVFRRLPRLDFIECLFDIVKYIFYVLDSNAKANQIWCDSCFKQLLFAKLTVSMTCRMQNAGAGISHVSND